LSEYGSTQSSVKKDERQWNVSSQHIARTVSGPSYPKRNS
jgi:hypothetical protein